MPMPELKPSQTVRVVQTVHTRERDWQTSVEGRIISLESQPTGSWFAHGKNDKLWLQRLRLEKTDGELVELVLDNDSVVTILKDVAEQP